MSAIAGTAQVVTFSVRDGVAESPAPAFLAVLDPDLDRAPTAVTIIMAGLEPLDEITFTIDTITIGEDTADINGDLAATSLSVDRIFGAGTHTITGTTPTHSASDTFTLRRNASNFPVNQTDDVDPVFIAEAVGANGVHKWVLQDLMPGGLGSWVMPINPTTMSAPHVKKTVGAVHSTAVEGSHHVYEGITPTEWDFAGFCPDQAFYLKLLAYSELPRRCYLIDHRNRAWIIAFANLDVKARKRVRDEQGADHDWLSDYSAKVVLYSQQFKTPVGS